MSKRPPRPPGAPWLMPYLIVKDANAALEFYQRAFGFDKKEAMTGPDGKIKHAEVVWKDAIIMFGPEGEYHGLKYVSPATSGVTPPIGLYLYVDDVDAFFAKATAAGAKVERPLEDQFWGDRTCSLLDPDGHRWSFGTNVADCDLSKAPPGH